MKGILISFEGIDGSGKSTQAGLLERSLRTSGRNVILLREPGGTAVGERIRSILLDRAHDDMAPLAEVFLYLAARAQITAQCIVPALERGDIVIMDRFRDSTTVYQGFARGLGTDNMERLNDIATGGVTPDITFVIDCETPYALSRVGESPDRLESEGLSFMERVREGFLRLCETGGNRVILIDGGRDIDSVQNEVRGVVDYLLSDQKS